MKFQELKRGLFTSPQSGSKQFEMYVIENINDLNSFFNKFDLLKSTIQNWIKYVQEGRIILVNDAHYMTGYPTYCFETMDKTNMHSSSFHRVKLL